MDKQAAERLITNTFNYPFDIGKYKLLSRNIFKEFEEAEFSRHGTYIPEAFRSHIKKYERLGKYEDAQGRGMDILIVYIKEGLGLDRARTLQRNFISNYLDDTGKDAALVAFTTTDMEDWRFSLITIDYKTVQDESGKIKTERVLSSAKRFSFLVGKNEANHTAQQQVIPLLVNNNAPSIEDLEHAFSVEQVTDEFYQEYKKRFLELGYEINRVLGDDEKIKREFAQQNISTDNFAKKLMGQIVFLYFVQKKGWLGVGKDDDGDFLKWGDGDKKFMRSLFEKKFCEYDNFFNDVLEPLFYEALATERANNYYSNFECKIPFLSGGLFEPMNGYNWQETDITISNNVIELILDTFDRYNFTVREDDPLDKEVAIDPEMLGKVFENLLPENLKKGNGAFYTPRPIVHYMCQESLINYLDTHLNDVDKTDITLLVKEGEAVIEHDKIAKTKKEGYKGKYEIRMPSSIIENATEIDELLKYVKICDPAIGSGAFPMGLLHEIVVARNVLTAYIGNEHSRAKFHLKEDCIQNSIYGVDIDEGAIEISKLRLWLSLIVDEDDIENIKPLPNLDYKIICGNSLISRYELDSPINVVFSEFNKKVKSKDYKNKSISDLVGNQEIDLNFYKKLTNDFLSESSHNKKILFRTLIGEIKNAFKTELEDKDRAKLSESRGVLENLGVIDIFGNQVGTKTEISKAKKKLEKLEKQKQDTQDGALYKNAIEWRFEFPNLLNESGDFLGFDIVIENPPYVDSEEMTKSNNAVRTYLSKKMLTTKGNWDLFVPFIESGLRLLKYDGIFCNIIPNKLFSAKYTKSLRELLLLKDILEIRDYSRLNVFKSASVYPVTVLIKNKQPVLDKSVSTVVMEGLSEIKVTNTINKKTFYTDIFWDRYFLDEECVALLTKLFSFQKIKDLDCNILGAATVSEAYEVKKYLLDSKTLEGKKLINTGTIDPFISLWGIKPTQYIKAAYKYPKISENDISTINERRLVQSNTSKIIIAGMSKNIEAFYDSGEYLAGKSTTIILGDYEKLIFLLGVLNSKLIGFYVSSFYHSLKMAGGYLNISKEILENIPINTRLSESQSQIINIVKKILITKNSNQDADIVCFQENINNLIYKLYELTYEEVLIVDEAFALNELEYNNFEL